MGQRSQIYIRYNVENNKGLIARYYQWNYGERMISRARGIIEALTSEFLQFKFMWSQETYLTKLKRICDINWDMRDIVMSSDILEEVQKYWDSDCNYIFNQDNNDGQLLIDVTSEGIKYCFISYDDTKPMNCKQYLIWDNRMSEDDSQIEENQFLKPFDEETSKYILENINYINENAKLMTQEEVDDFLNEDYSYLFENKS